MTVDERAPRPGRRRAVLAWTVPVAVTAALAGAGVLVGANASSASPRLPTQSAQALLTQIQKHVDTPLSGEVVESASLGLPSLPGAGSSASLSWQSFLTGTHKVRVWADGSDRQRAALIGQLSEADVVHNGRDVWTYTSSSNSVSHTVLPARGSNAGSNGAAAYNPSTVAAQILKAVNPSTKVGVDSSRYVAGRAAYTLVITPRSADSTVQKVTLAVDAHTYVPLEVAVYGSGNSQALKIGFTTVSFTRPSASVFAFRTPAGASTTTDPFGIAGSHRGSESRMPGSSESGRSSSSTPHPTVIGTGWTSVLEFHGTSGIPGLDGRTLQDLTTAVGTSGERLLQTKLVNAVFMPDGRVFVGAVKPAVVERVAAATPH